MPSSPNRQGRFISNLLFASLNDEYCMLSKHCNCSAFMNFVMKKSSCDLVRPGGSPILNRFGPGLLAGAVGLGASILAEAPSTGCVSEGSDCTFVSSSNSSGGLCRCCMSIGVDNFRLGGLVVSKLLVRTVPVDDRRSCS